jgi:hypothetical protein
VIGKREFEREERGRNLSKAAQQEVRWAKKNERRKSLAIGWMVRIERER